MLLTRAIESADIYHVERAVCKRVFFFWWGGTKLKCLKKKHSAYQKALLSLDDFLMTISRLSMICS